MNGDDVQPDGALTNEKLHSVEKLTDAEVQAVDDVLLANSSHHWRKVARVGGTTMREIPGRFEGIPDVFYGRAVPICIGLST